MKGVLKTEGSRLLAVGVFTLVTGFIGATITLHSLQKQIPQATLETTVSEPQDMITIAALGDIIPHDSIVTQAKTQAGYDFAPYYTNIRKSYKDVDSVFCNVESPVAGDELGTQGYPEFNAPSRLATDLVDAAGCKVVNMANNHIYDKGQPGIDISRDHWLKAGAVVSGANKNQAEQDQVTYFDVRGKKFALVSFAEFSNKAGYAPHSINLLSDESLMERLLTEAQQKAQFVIVSAHWGTEDSTEVNKEQEKYAQKFAEFGAHLVIGTGPHVIQKVDQLTGKAGNKTLVLYSIGNSLNSQLAVNELTGIIPVVSVRPAKNNNLQVASLRVIPTYMAYDWPQDARQREELSARTNLSYDSLQAQKDRIPKMFPGETFDTRLSFIRATLGERVRYELVR